MSYISKIEEIMLQLSEKEERAKELKKESEVKEKEKKESKAKEMTEEAKKKEEEKEKKFSEKFERKFSESSKGMYDRLHSLEESMKKVVEMTEHFVKKDKE